MPLFSEAIRAAGNVLLEPINLTELAQTARWQRARLVGSRNADFISRAASALREAAPGIGLDGPHTLSLPPSENPTPLPPSPYTERGNGSEVVVCFLLTGEGFAWEKAAAVLSGAPTILAYGVNGQWYRVALPSIRLTSPSWWARLGLALGLAELYQAVILVTVLFDLCRRLVPVGHQPADPGSPSGRAVTFVVPNYNQRHLMDFCLPPLLAEAGTEHKVLVVDDASSDDTVAYVREHYPQVRVVALDQNRGFGGAVRAGIAASDTPLFALINTDVQVRPGFLAAILPHFDRPDTFAVCSRIDLPGGSPMETGNVAAAWSGVLEPYHVAPDCQGPILYAGGASSVYNRAKYEAIGGFETIYRPMYFEDIDLGYRAWRRNWLSLFEPAASVFHQRRAWIGTRFNDAQANETFLKNGLLFVWKNVRDPVMLAENCAYVCARLVQEVLGGQGTMARAFLRALPFLGQMLMKRWREHYRGDLSDRQILDLSQPASTRQNGASLQLAEGGTK